MNEIVGIKIKKNICNSDTLNLLLAALYSSATILRGSKSLLYEMLWLLSEKDEHTKSLSNCTPSKQFSDMQTNGRWENVD